MILIASTWEYNEMFLIKLQIRKINSPLRLKLLEEHMMDVSLGIQHRKENI